MSFAIERIDHVVLNCSDVDLVADGCLRVLGMRREVFAGARAAWRRREMGRTCHAPKTLRAS
ncbi:VOC family protein [Mycolicibacterium sarraceniae]|uniref:hypothetical protein n=1 Tax=Mycolicibacterium sarraceniae TaxID=1534348 RepID=UPI0015D3BE91|nr:hypothetical protein [Mycolicibacterium sarraceniae]